MEQHFKRDLGELESIVAMTGRFFALHGIDAAKRPVVDLCVEELFVNMVTYDTETREAIALELTPTGAGVQVRITDYGVDRFDPRDGPAVDIDAPVDQRQPGGLGLYLVMKMVDSIHYEYSNRTSSITFVVGAESRNQTCSPSNPTTA